MKKLSLLFLLIIIFSASASSRLDEFIKRVKKLSVDAPEKQYVTFVSDLHKAGFTLPQLMIGTVKNIRDETLNFFVSHATFKPEFKDIKTKSGTFNNQFFDKYLQSYIAFKKKECKKPGIDWAEFTKDSDVTEDLNSLQRKTEKEIREIFGSKFIYLMSTRFITSGPAGIKLELNTDNKVCRYTLLYPVSLIHDPNRRYVLNHELIHLIRNHQFKRGILDAMMEKTPKNNKILLQYLKAEEIEADVFSFLLNVQNMQEARAYMHALLPWDSPIFRFFYKRSPYKLSKILELAISYGPSYVFGKELVDHPTSISRMQWALRWQRLFKAQESLDLPDKDKMKPFLPKELDKRILAIEKEI